MGHRKTLVHVSREAMLAIPYNTLQLVPISTAQVRRELYALGSLT
jgi:hypothetical protein